MSINTMALMLARSVVLAGAITAWAYADGAAESEPDDRLPRESEHLLDELVQRGMPELVETFVADLPAMYRVYAARAAVNAGLGASDAAERERFFEQAAEHYRAVLLLGDDANWLVGERRRFHLADWHVEFGDLILRQWSVRDLDRFEITSGLDFNRARLESRLREADRNYRRGSSLLTRLHNGLRSDDELYLLLGIAGEIPKLERRCDLNGAWASLYLGMLSEPDGADRADLLASSLHKFDALARNEREPAQKYNALLGAGLALRETGRLEEAEAAFDRVRDSTAPLSVTARARYEKARLQIRQSRFENARATLTELAAIPERRLTVDGSGAEFYVRLAPLIAAYTYMREAEAGEGDARKDAREKTLRAFGSIAERGTYWSAVVAVYLDAMAGGHRELLEWSDGELRFEARRLMAAGKYGQAIGVLRVLLDRDDSDSNALDEARYNLAVCQFQSGDMRAAAETFLTEARSAKAAHGRQAAEFAFRCWRRIAAESKSVEDCRKLHDAAVALADKFADHPLSSEALWLSAVALEEAGDYSAAKSAYDAVPARSANYWSARRNGLRCLKRLNSALTDAAPSDRAGALRKEAGAWQKLAADLASAADAAMPKGVDRGDWIDQARLNAAALLASPVLGEYRQSLKVLESLPDSAAVLSLRIRCYRATGDLKRANAVLGEFMEKSPGAEAGRVLLDLAAAMEAEVDRLRSAGLHDEAESMASEMVELMKRLIDWVESQPDRRQHAPIAQFGLAKALAAAGRDEEAATVMEKLLPDVSDNGDFLHFAARLYERLPERAATGSRGSAADRAESLWARLLSDAKLRERSPDVYWEARYYWLKHQLRRKRAAEVVRGIEAEQAWYPELGGPPWHGRILELEAKARSMLKGEAP